MYRSFTQRKNIHWFRGPINQLLYTENRLTANTKRIVFYFIATAQQVINISTCDNYKLKYAIGHAFCVCNFESNSSSGLGTVIIYSHIYLLKETLILQLIVLCSDFSIKETQSNGFKVEQSFLCSLSTALLLIRFCFLLHGTIFGRRTQAPA